MNFSRICVATFSWSLLLYSQASAYGADTPSPFAGPFPSWIDVKNDFGAKGDGVTDDTPAIQRALASAAAYGGSRFFVYFPAGVYRITSTLWITDQSLGVIGDDPATTVLQWAGPAGQDMVLINGAAHSNFGRLTLDGQGSASGGLHFAWNGYVPNDTMDVAIFDAIFQNLARGVIGGQAFPGNGDSEVAIARSVFRNCSQAGLSVETYNAVNYWVWDSAFYNNARGVTNEFGAGAFQVYRSVFSGSSVADATIAQWSPFFSLRGNTSIGSAQFLKIATASTAMTVQGNKILDTTNPVSIDVRSGNLLLIDNQIRSVPGTSGPVVWMHQSVPGGDLLSVGNQFTTANAVVNDLTPSRALQIDDQVVSPFQIDGSIPALPATPPLLKQNHFEVPAGATVDVIQNTINQTISLAGQHPVVHLPAGWYDITKTITIPANLDVIITGDHMGTMLNAKNLSGPMFRLQGPSKAIVQDLRLSGAGTDGFLIENADQAGGRVYGESLYLTANTGGDVWADRLANTHVELHGAMPIRGGPASIKAIGLGSPTDSRITLFGGTSSGMTASGTLYEVLSGGQILAEDMWYESGNGPSVVRLTGADSGIFTLQGSNLSQGSSGVNSPIDHVIDINGFSGLATILGGVGNLPTSDPNRYAIVQNTTSQTNVLISGMIMGQPNALLQEGSAGQISFILNKYWDPQYGPVQTSDAGKAINAPFLRTMLQQLRTTTPEPLSPSSAGVTDARLYRIYIQQAAVAVHIVNSSN